LEEDPGNWIARFYLGIALRRCSSNEEAARHLGFVQHLFERVEHRLSTRLFPGAPYYHTTFLEHNLLVHPECTVIVTYNRAMALSKQRNLESMNTALDLLSAIIALCAERPGAVVPDFRYSVSRMTNARRHKFASVARSAQAIVWAAQAEFICPEHLGTSAKGLLDRVVAVEIEAESDRKARDSWRQADAAALEWADATIFNAKGKILSVLGETMPARGASLGQRYWYLTWLTPTLTLPVPILMLKTKT